MEPVKFPKHNVVYAENQPEYLDLPAYADTEESISCWKLGWFERLKILFTGTLWLRQLNFGQPLQPQLPQVNFPFNEEKFK